MPPLPNFAPPLSDGVSRPFYEGLEQGELRLTACPECGRIYWYPPELLPCHPSLRPAWRAVSPIGIVYSFTTIMRSLLPGADPDSVPHTIVLVEPLDAPGARVIGLMADDTGEGIGCGDHVRLHPIDMGTHIIPGFVRVEAGRENQEEEA